MKTLNVEKIATIAYASEISGYFDQKSLESHLVSVVNWNEYPYKPEVKFRIAHDGENIYINWKISEEEIKAVCEEDQGEVWKDSCAEFFVSFNDSPVYYNIESNCIGKILVATGVDRNDRTPVPAQYLAKVQRYSSLGNKAVHQTAGNWELSLIIPKDLFYLDEINNLSGITAHANFYKCGDDLNQPHFLSWNPIDNSTPNFHLSNFFGKLQFK